MKDFGKESERTGDLSEFFLNLTCQFSSGTENDHGNETTFFHAAHFIAFALALSKFYQTRQGGQAKCQRFTGSGTTAANNIATCQYGVKRFALDGSKVSNALATENVNDSRTETGFRPTRIAGG
jgi:hypothetical protein